MDDLATHTDATIRYHASDIILQIHSNASYLTEPKSRSRIGGRFFLGKETEKGKPIYLNGAIHTVWEILKHVITSAAEAELGAIFINAKEGKVTHLTLSEMGHVQPPTPMHTDNTTANSIANGTIKCQMYAQLDGS